MLFDDIGNSLKIKQETIETIHVQANRTITATNNSPPDFYPGSSNAHRRDTDRNPSYRKWQGRNPHCRPSDHQRPPRPEDRPCNMMKQKTGVCFIPRAPPAPITSTFEWKRQERGVEGMSVAEPGLKVSRDGALGAVAAPGQQQLIKPRIAGLSRQLGDDLGMS